MRSRFYVAPGLLMVAAVACATGAGDFEGDDEEPRSTASGEITTSSSSSVSAASGSTSAGSGGAGGAGGSANGGAGGSLCEESPCKLVEPQCGCGGDEQCSLSSGERACVPVGDVPWKELCGQAAACAPGGLCVTVTGMSLCGKFCDDDAQCGGPGGLCIRELGDGNGGVLPDVLFCTESCDPATSVGCPAKGTSCQMGKEEDGLGRFFSVCLASGFGTQGASCMSNADCAPSFSCFSDGIGKQCMKNCKVASPSCPAGTQCNEITVEMEPVMIGNEQYGACF